MLYSKHSPKYVILQKSCSNLFDSEVQVDIKFQFKIWTKCWKNILLEKYINNGIPETTFELKYDYNSIVHMTFLAGVPPI